MREDINVHVIKRKDQKNLFMRYKDPVTGRQVSKSTSTNRKKEAAMVAGAWQAELREGRYKSPSKVSWGEFQERYENEVVPSLAERTSGKIDAMFSWIKRELDPNRLSKLDSERIGFLQRRMREGGLAESTIKSHMAHLKSALNWAKRAGMLNEIPEIVMPKRAKSSKMMKGRPITGEEFDRLLEKVEESVGAKQAQTWKDFLIGLWWSGLRLGEALELTWDDNNRLCVDTSGKRIVIRIPAELEKGNQDRLLPVAPEFAEMLLSVPENKRTGFVFNPKPTRGAGTRLTMLTVSKRISEIGQKAGIKVSETGGKVKFASAHDLRRSFGARWSVRVSSQVLMELMRHESIETTLKYYVGQNAQATADVLYDSLPGDSGGDPGNSYLSSEIDNDAQTPKNTEFKKHPRYDSNVRPTD